MLILKTISKFSVTDGHFFIGCPHIKKDVCSSSISDRLCICLPFWFPELDLIPSKQPHNPPIYWVAKLRDEGEGERAAR